MFRSRDEFEHKNFYRQSIKKYGLKDVRSLHWNSTKTQQIRFKALLHIGDMTHKTVLDLGSGTGDFYGFLIKNRIVPQTYFGVDFLKEFVDISQQKFPQAQWVCSDFFDLPVRNYDFIICNGALNVKQKNNIEFLKHFLQRFVPWARVGLGVTLLKYAPGYLENPMIYTYDVLQVKQLLDSLGLHYTLYQDYIDNDFTVIIHKAQY